MSTITPLPAPAWASAVTTARKQGRPKSCFLYGVPGTRKTSIAASIAKVDGFERVLVIDIDNGTTVLSGNPEYANIDVLPINPLEAGAFAKLDSVIKDVVANDYGYDAVVLDTFSVAQDVAERNFKQQFANSSASGKKDTFAVYGALGEWSMDVVWGFHTAPHFTGIITCHSSEKRNEAGVVEIKPLLSGSSKDTLASVPDLVAYLSYARHPETNEKHLIATVGEAEGLLSKNRWGLPDVLIDFDLPRLYSLIDAKIGTQEAVASASVEATPAASAA